MYFRYDENLSDAHVLERLQEYKQQREEGGDRQANA